MAYTEGTTFTGREKAKPKVSTSTVDKTKQQKFFRAYKAGLLDDTKITNDGWKSLYEYELEKGYSELKDLPSDIGTKYGVDTSIGIKKSIIEPIVEPTLAQTTPTKEDNGLLSRLFSLLGTNKGGLPKYQQDIDTSILTKPTPPTPINPTAFQGVLDTQNKESVVKPRFGNMNNENDPLIMALQSKLDPGFMGQKTKDIMSTINNQRFNKQRVEQGQLNSSGIENPFLSDGVVNPNYSNKKPIPQSNNANQPFLSDGTINPTSRMVNDPETESKLKAIAYGFGNEFIGKTLKRGFKEQDELSDKIANAIPDSSPMKKDFQQSVINRAEDREYWTEERMFNAFIGKPHDSEITKGEKTALGVGGFAGNLGKLMTFSMALGMPSSTSGMLVKNAQLGALSGAEGAYGRGEDTENILKDALIGAGSFTVGELAGIGVTNKLTSQLVHTFKANPQWASHITGLVRTARGVADGTVGTIAQIGLSNVAGRETELELKDAIQSGIIMGVVSGVTSYIPWERFASSPKDMKNFNVKLAEVDDTSLRGSGYIKLSEVEGANTQNPYLNDLYINPGTKDIVIASTKDGAFLVPKSMVEGTLDSETISLIKSLENNPIRRSVNPTEQIDYIDKNVEPGKYAKVLNSFMENEGYELKNVEGEQVFSKYNKLNNFEGSWETISLKDAETKFESDYFTHNKYEKANLDTTKVEPRTKQTTMGKFSDDYEVNRGATDSTSRQWVRDMQDKGYKEFKPGVWVQEVDGKIVDIVPEFTGGKNGKAIPVFDIKADGEVPIKDMDNTKGFLNSEYDTSDKSRSNPFIEYKGIKDYVEAELKGVRELDQKAYDEFMGNIKTVDKTMNSIDLVEDAVNNEVYSDASENISQFLKNTKVTGLMDFFKNVDANVNPSTVASNMKEFNKEYQEFFFAEDKEVSEENTTISEVVAESTSSVDIESNATSQPEMKELIKEAKTGEAYKATLYHGTGASKEDVYNGLQKPILGNGSYYANNEDEAKMYGDTVTTEEVTLNNPLVLDNDTDWRKLTMEAKWRYPNIIGLDEEEQSKHIDDMNELLQSKGYDGVVIKISEDSDVTKTMSKMFGHSQVVSFNQDVKESKPEVAKPEEPTVDEELINRIKNEAKEKAYLEEIKAWNETHGVYDKDLNITRGTIEYANEITNSTDKSLFDIRVNNRTEELINDEEFKGSIKKEIDDSASRLKREKEVEASFDLENYQVPLDLFIERIDFPEAVAKDKFKKVIEKAIKEGKEIPENVMEDYNSLISTTKVANPKKEEVDLEEVDSEDDDSIMEKPEAVDSSQGFSIGDKVIDSSTKKKHTGTIEKFHNKDIAKVIWDHNGSSIFISLRFLEKLGYEGQQDEEVEEVKVEKKVVEESTPTNVGYHAGDLGKAESFFNMASGSRGTGHFGTGTYFVGDKEAINLESYRNRPQHTISFDGYNLFKPKNEEEATKLHDVLKFVNNYYNKLDELVASKNFEADFQEYQDKVYALDGMEGTQDVIDEAEEDLEQYIQDSYLIAKSQIDKAKERANGDFSKYIYIIQDKIEENIKYGGFIYRRLDSYETFQESLNVIPRLTEKEAFRIMKDVAKEVFEELGEDWFMNEKSQSADSVSTRFMKELWYDGVDVRHLKHFDNTQYGSVIYDLKGVNNKPVEDNKTSSNTTSQEDNKNASTDLLRTTEVAEEIGETKPTTLSDYGITIENAKTKSGTEVWHVKGNVSEYKDILSKGDMGGLWYGGGVNAFAFNKRKYPTMESLEKAILERLSPTEIEGIEEVAEEVNVSVPEVKEEVKGLKGEGRGLELEGPNTETLDTRNEGTNTGSRKPGRNGSINDDSVQSDVGESTTIYEPTRGPSISDNVIQQGENSINSDVPSKNEASETSSKGQDTGSQSNVNNDSEQGQSIRNEGHTSGDTKSDGNQGEVTSKINQNYQIDSEDDIFSKGSKKVRYKSNAEALKTLIPLLESGRNATPEEQKILAGYSGWGAIQEAFDPRKSDWYNEFNELKSLIEKIETLIPKKNNWRNIYESMRSSTQNAFYTDPKVIREIYRAMAMMGFKKGSILEPSMGTGYFFGTMPINLRDKTRLYGVELEPVTGNIAKLLYPNADIRVMGFQESEYPDNYFDIAIGNVPFGDIEIRDDKYPDYMTNKIHNYFFGKSLDKVKPGGLVAFITSTGTLDAVGSQKTREYISTKAKLVGAIRLPSDTFKDIAGTAVTSDIIILQKLKKGEVATDTSWTNVIDINVDGKLLPINKYYSEHPEMMLGEVVEDTLFGKRVALVNKDGNTIERLTNAVTSYIPKNIYNQISSNTLMVADDSMKDYFKDGLEGSVLEKNKKLYRKIDGKIYEITENVAKIRALYNLKTLTSNILTMQREIGVDVPKLETMRKELKKSYEAYIKTHGKLLTKSQSKGKYVGNYEVEKDFGYYKTVINSNKKAEKKFFTEPESYKLKALELETITTDSKGNEVQVITPSKILSERTNQPIIPKTKVDSAVEGLITSINFLGFLDMNYISELYGKDEEAIVKELGDKIYQNPLTNEYETSDAYLSGDVRGKLKQAKLFAETNNEYDRNVKALEKALPEDVKFANIEVRLGDSWIPYEVTKKMIIDMMGLPTWDDKVVQLEYDIITSSWSLSKGNSTFRITPEMNTISAGIPSKTAIAIVKTALNNTSTSVEYKDDEGKKYVHKKESNAFKVKVDELRKYAKEWLFKHPEDMKSVETAYNEKLNNIVSRDYTEMAKTFSFDNVDKGVDLRDHQKVAVVRGLLGGNTLLAHGVGAGKTFEEIVIAVEAKRLGLANKPVLVVPNSKLTDFENDAKKLYPGINMLALDENDFNTDNIKRTLALAGTNNWDLVIIRHSSFTKIPVSPDTQIPILMEEVAQLEDALFKATSNGVAKYTVKQIENRLEKLRQKLEDFQDNKHSYEGMMFFEDIGFDYIIVDEAHEYKSYPLSGRSASIKGLHIGDSDKAMDMMIKTRYVSSLHNNKRGVVFATGTPITNSMAETYIMFKYLRPDLMEDAGITSFDMWADAFADVTGEMEIKPTGKIQHTTRFTRFVNLPQLITKFKEFTDIQFTDELGLPLPEFEMIKVECEPHPLLNEVSEMVKDNWEQAIIDKKLFTYFNMMKQAPQDIRFVIEGAENHAGSKINKVTDNVYKIWKDKKKDKATQLIFLFRGKSTTPSFDMWEELKTTLVNKGIPSNEVAYVTGETKESDLEEIYRKVNAGIIRVVIGSYAKMGVGINVQEKLFAIHEIDIPHRPVDLEQAEGRIIRQGNTYFGTGEAVKIYRYVTVGEDGAFSGDAFSWQLVEKKLRDIRAIMKGDKNITTLDVGDEDDGSDGVSEMAQLKASALNDERWFKQSAFEKAVEYLDAEHNSFKSSQSEALYLQQRATKVLEESEDKLNAYNKAIKIMEPYKDNKQIILNNPYRNTFVFDSPEERKIINDAIKKLIVDKKENKIKYNHHLAGYKGLDFYYEYEEYETKTIFGWIGRERITAKFSNNFYSNPFYVVYNHDFKDKEDLFYKNDEFDYIRQLNSISKVSTLAESTTKLIENQKSDIGKYQETIKATFPKVTELEYKRAMSKSINIALGMDEFNNTGIQEVDLMLQGIYDAISYFDTKDMGKEAQDVIDISELANDIRTNAKMNKEDETEVAWLLERLAPIREIALKTFKYNPSESKKTKPVNKATVLNKKASKVKSSIPFETAIPLGRKTNTNIKPISEIVKDIERDFGISVSSKRFRSGKGAVGQFQEHSESVRVKHDNDIQTIAHELGHKFDKDYKLSDRFSEYIETMNEGLNLSEKYKEEEIPGEVIAEFIRLYLVSDGKAQELSPDFYNSFMETISAKDLKNLNKHREDILNWYGAELTLKGQSTIRSHTQKVKVPMNTKIVNVEMEIFDDLAPIRRLADTVELYTGEKLKYADNPYVLAMYSRRAGMVAKAQIVYAQSDIEGNILGESLNEVLKDIHKAETRAFDDYLKVSHAITLHGFGHQIYNKEFTLENMELMKATYERDYSHFKEIAQNVYKWWNRFIEEWVVKAGFMEQSVWADLQERYPTYVPNFRVPDDTKGNFSTTSKKGFGNQRTPIKRLSKDGNDVDTYSVIESLVLYTDKIVKTQKKNEVGVAIHNLYKNVEGLGEIMTKITHESELHKYNAVGLKATLTTNLINDYVDKLTGEDKKYADGLLDTDDYSGLMKFLTKKGFAGVEIVDNTIEDVINFFTPRMFSTDSSVFTVVDKENKTHFYEVHDPLFLEAMLNLNDKTMDKITRWIGSVKRVFTNLTTGANPIFGLTSNIWADVPEAYAYGSYKNPFEFGVALGQSMLDLVKKDDRATSYYVMGGGLSSPISDNRKLMTEMLNKLYPDLKKSSVKNMAGYGLGLLEQFNDTIESAPRLNEYNKILKEYGDTYEGRLKAMYEANELTVNFLRHGRIQSTFLGQGVPFLNAGLQGMYKLNAEFLSQRGTGKNDITGDGGKKQDKKKFLSIFAKALTSITIFEIIQILAYENDEDYHKLSSYIKDAFWLIKQDDGTFIRIRKPRALGLLFSTTFRRGFQSAFGDKEGAWEGFLETFSNVILPPNPVTENLASGFIAVGRNKSWSGSPIVPMRLANLPPLEQYDTNTSEISKVVAEVLAKATGFETSPKNLDYLVQQYSGAIGQIALPMTTENKTLLGSLKQKVTTDVAYSNTLVNDFYENKEKLDQAYTTYNTRGKQTKDFDPVARYRYNQVNDDMSDLWSEINDIKENSSLSLKEKQAQERAIRLHMMDIVSEENLKPTSYDEFKVLYNKGQDLVSKAKADYEATKTKPKFTKEEETLVKLYSVPVDGDRGELGVVNYQITQINKKRKLLEASTVSETNKEKARKTLDEAEKKLTDSYMVRYNSKIGIDINKFFK